MKKFDKESFKDVTLLYVEDDLMTIEEISYFLQKYVKKLIIAKDGKEGLELFKKHKPDIVITDIQMPKMNGLEMSEEILKTDPSVPIVLTTAYSDSQYLIRAIELGIDKYIVKPINMLELLTIVQKSLFIKKEVAKVEYCDYLEFILDNNATFMFVVHSSEIEYANKKLLDILGFENIDTFNRKFMEDNNIIEIDNANNKNWLDYVTENNSKRFLVHLKNENIYKREFYLKYKYFESINRSVFILIDTNEEKLDRIHTVTLQLLEKLDNGISSESLMSELKNIVQISNRD